VKELVLANYTRGSMEWVSWKTKWDLVRIYSGSVTHDSERRAEILDVTKRARTPQLLNDGVIPSAPYSRAVMFCHVFLG
jgi:hypothetical protein